jgi:L-asparagine transporter-like permease
MIFELCASFVLSYLTRHSPLSMLANVALALTLIVWIATFALQVPCHNRLGKGFDEAVHMRLVRTNWLRTVGWTLRSGVLVALLLRVLG